jgi:prevent-host-death family protein
MGGGSRRPRRAREPPRKRPAEWQLTDAKARFSELFDRALKTPQRVSRHGKDSVVILSAREYERFAGSPARKGKLVDFLATLHFGELDLDRDEPFDRDVEL